MGPKGEPSKSVLLRRCGTRPPVARTKRRLAEPSDRERRLPNRRQVQRTKRSCHSGDRERCGLLHLCHLLRSSIGTARRLNPYRGKDAIGFPAGQTHRVRPLTHPESLFCPSSQRKICRPVGLRDELLSHERFELLLWDGWQGKIAPDADGYWPDSEGIILRLEAFARNHGLV
jgi:hypothetical protein